MRDCPVDEIRALSDDWRQVVEGTGGDPLFLSAEWHTAWWDVFGGTSDLDWAGLAAFDPSGRFVAALPLVKRSTHLRKLLRVRRLEFSGGAPAFRQYVDLVGDGSNEALVNDFMDALERRPGWDELLLDGMLTHGVALQQFAMAARNKNWFVRLQALPPSMRVRFEDGFEAYRAGLGAKTRRKVFNLRKRLETLGTVQLTEVPAERADDYFDLMNRFRRRTRGQVALGNRATRFHRLLIERLAPWGELRLSCLSVNGSPVSVNYSIEISDASYGIQLGYDADVAPGLSLGAIHVGYALEAAAERGMGTYDLLGGQGSDQGWKSHLATEEVPLVAAQIVRSRPLAFLYRAHDRARGRRAPGREQT